VVAAPASVPTGATARVVGRNAAHMGKLAAAADNLADSVGANEPGAANHLYQAAALLRDQALQLASDYREAHPDAPVRDGST
jgi:hypothetical protein